MVRILEFLQYMMVLLQNNDFVQRYHVEIGTVLFHGAVVIYGLANPLIMLDGIPALKEKFLSLFPWSKNKVAPAAAATVARDVALHANEADIRMQALTNQWNAALHVGLTD